MQLPSLGGNWVDFVIVVFIVFYVWDGWGKSFISQVFEVLAFVGSFVIGLKFYPAAAKLFVDNFSFPKGLANAGGFFGIAVIIEQILSYFGLWLQL